MVRGGHVHLSTAFANNCVKYLFIMRRPVVSTPDKLLTLEPKPGKRAREHIKWVFHI